MPGAGPTQVTHKGTKQSERNTGSHVPRGPGSQVADSSKDRVEGIRKRHPLKGRIGPVTLEVGDTQDSCYEPVSHEPARCQPCHNWLWAPRRGLEWRPRILTPSTIPPAAPAQALLCSPSLSLQRLPSQPRPLCKVTSLPAAGTKLSKQSSPGRAGGEPQAAAPPPLPCVFLRLPALTPSAALPLERIHFFHPASPNFTPTYSHLPGFPSCNLQLLSPPPPGLRDTKGFTHPHRHHHRHRQTDQ